MTRHVRPRIYFENDVAFWAKIQYLKISDLGGELDVVAIHSGH